MRTKVELSQAFLEQCQALRSSCMGYDAGSLWEAKRIATTIFNLVYDRGGRTQSILTQMGEKDRILYFSTCKPRHPGNLVSFWSPLVRSRVEMYADGTGSTKARAASVSNFDAPMSPRKLMSFDRWWNEAVYSGDSETLSRATLLATLRDKEGGSHFDSQVTDPTYLRLKSGMDSTLRMSIGGVETETPIASSELATGRQIGYELEVTFRLAGLFQFSSLPV